MNITRLKQNLFTLIGGFIVLLATGVILWFIRGTVQATNRLDADITKASTEISQLRSAKVFPSEENIKLLQDDLMNMQQLYGELVDGVSSSKIEVEPMHGGVRFVGFLRQHQQSLREEARTNNVTVPDSFSFGLSRYDSAFPCRTPELKGDQCTQLLSGLAKQVLTVEKICQMLFQAKVQQLAEIRRVDIEGGQATTDALAANIATKGLYTTTPFEFHFSCDTAALQEFLNAVAQADWFLTIRSLKVETETYAKAISAPAITETSIASLVSPLSPLTPGAGATATPLTETRYRLSVTVRIDLVEFAEKDAKKNRDNR